MINEKTLKDAQKIMLEILIEVDRICMKNNIEYWLADGTLLGAVRHRGFISWDDDIDICMLKEEYNKFLEIAPKELKEKFFLQTSKYDKNYNFLYPKIRDRNSIFIEKYDSNQEKFHQGLNLDIFVMDRYFIRSKILYRFLYFFKNIKIENNRINNYYFFKKIIVSFKLNICAEKILKFFLTNKKQNSRLGYRYYWKQLYKYNDIFPLKEIEFEGYKFSCPNNTDAYLKELYGDTYMELPPEKDRVWHAKEIRLNEKCFFEKELERTGRKLYEEQ